MDALRAQVLDLGGHLDGFDHWRERSAAKPSDPDDIRWDCSCGYAGSPDTVRGHWSVMFASGGLCPSCGHPRHSVDKCDGRGINWRCGCSATEVS